MQFLGRERLNLFLDLVQCGTHLMPPFYRAAPLAVL
jgi:hypothetical protein